MIDLSKAFGAFICTVQLAVVTSVLLYLSNFIPSPVASIVFAAVLCAFVIGATQFFNRILALTDNGLVAWLSVTPVLAAMFLWGSFVVMRSIREMLQLLQGIGGPAQEGSLMMVFGGGSLVTPILLQVGLLAGAYVLLVPRVRAGTLKAPLLVLPVVGNALGAWLGWLIATSFAMV